LTNTVVGCGIRALKHEGHEDTADLAAACGGEAMCERQRPDKTWGADLGVVVKVDLL
jgi:hypothetical protein